MTLVEQGTLTKHGLSGLSGTARDLGEQAMRTHDYSMQVYRLLLELERDGDPFAFRVAQDDTLAAMVLTCLDHADVLHDKAMQLGLLPGDPDPDE